MVRRGGGIEGVSSQLGFVPEHKLGIAVLSNLEDKPLSRLWLAAVNAVLGSELEAPLYTSPVRKASKVKVAFLGSYRSDEPWDKFDIWSDGDTLFARSGEALVAIGRVQLATSGEFLIGLAPHYDVERVRHGATGYVCGVPLETCCLTRQSQN